MCKLLILTFKAHIDCTAPLYLCELIEQQKSSTNTRLANDAFLLKLLPPSRNCSDTFFEYSFTYGAQYEWNKLDGSKRHSLQAVELSQWFQAAVQIVSNLPAPSNGGPIYRFLGMPAMRTRCCSQKRVMSRPIQVRQL